VQDFHEGEYVDRELVLVKVAVGLQDARRGDAKSRTFFARQNRGRCSPRASSLKSPAAESKGGEIHQPDGSVGVQEITRTGQDRIAPASDRSHFVAGAL